MGLLGYHFYAVKDKEGVSNLLVSKAEMTKQGVEVQAVRLASRIYLHAGVR